MYKGNGRQIQAAMSTLMSTSPASDSAEDDCSSEMYHAIGDFVTEEEGKVNKDVNKTQVLYHWHSLVPALTFPLHWKRKRGNYLEGQSNSKKYLVCVLFPLL